MDFTPEFLNCFRLGDILEGRGGNNPNDNGGETGAGGWDQADYDGYRTRKALPLQSVDLATLDERMDCYLEEYYLGAGCNLLSGPLDFIVYQRVLNMNKAYSIADLQEIVGTKVDFNVGPKTAAACELYGWGSTSRAMLTSQAEAYRSIIVHSNTVMKVWAQEGRQGSKPHDQRSFGPGWLNRCSNAAALSKFTWAPDPALVAFMNAQHADYLAGTIPA